MLKATLGLLLMCVVIAGILITQANQQVGFSKDDLGILQDLFPGGKFSNDEYIRCELGRQVHYYPNGRRVFTNTDCWR